MPDRELHVFIVDLPVHIWSLNFRVSGYPSLLGSSVCSLANPSTRSEHSSASWSRVLLNWERLTRKEPVSSTRRTLSAGTPTQRAVSSIVFHSPSSFPYRWHPLHHREQTFHILQHHPSWLPFKETQTTSASRVISDPSISSSVVTLLGHNMNWIMGFNVLRRAPLIITRHETLTTSVTVMESSLKFSTSRPPSLSAPDPLCKSCSTYHILLLYSKHYFSLV